MDFCPRSQTCQSKHMNPCLSDSETCPFQCSPLAPGRQGLAATLGGVRQAPSCPFLGSEGLQDLTLSHRRRAGNLWFPSSNLELLQLGWCPPTSFLWSWEPWGWMGGVLLDEPPFFSRLSPWGLRWVGEKGAKCVKRGTLKSPGQK